MIKLYQLEARKVYWSKQPGMRILEWDAGPWEKMLGKIPGIVENGVMRTAEETWEDDDNGCGRYVG